MTSPLDIPIGIRLQQLESTTTELGIVPPINWIYRNCGIVTTGLEALFFVLQIYLKTCHELREHLGNPEEPTCVLNLEYSQFLSNLETSMRESITLYTEANEVRQRLRSGLVSAITRSLRNSSDTRQEQADEFGEILSVYAGLTRRLLNLSLHQFDLIIGAYLTLPLGEELTTKINYFCELSITQILTVNIPRVPVV
jgi:hypothetical protein